ncbi:MAG: hypothetical protein WCT35_10910 [Sideroxydans sp.]
MNNLLRDQSAALRGVGSGITHFAHEPSPKLRFRNPGPRSGKRYVHSGCCAPCALHLDLLVTVLHRHRAGLKS